MSIRYLILALTMRCNLRCSYCYYGESWSKTDMPSAAMQRAVSLAAADGQPFHLQITGGEPTLVPDLIQEAAALAHKTGICNSMGIQTNGTSLTPDLLELFKTHAFQVGVSLDGPPSVQQKQRGMAAETLRGLRLLDSEGIPFRITTVLTRSNTDVLDQLVLTLAGFAGVRGIGLDLLVNKGRVKNATGVAPPDKQTLKKGLHRMLKALDAINAQRAVPIRLRERDLLISAEKRHRSIFCHACLGESMAVQPDGRIFPCGQTLGDSLFDAGTVWAPQFENLQTLLQFRPNKAQCNTCELKEICPGDCPSRLYYNKHDSPTRVCDLYRTLWQIKKDRTTDP